MIFKRVGDVRPYPDHGYVQKQWAAIAPHQVRLDQLVTTKRTLDLEALLERLKAAQTELIAVVAKAGGMPSDKTLSKIADLELSIGAVEHALDEK